MLGNGQGPATRILVSTSTCLHKLAAVACYRKQALAHVALVPKRSFLNLISEYYGRFWKVGKLAVSAQPHAYADFAAANPATSSDGPLGELLLVDAMSILYDAHQEGTVQRSPTWRSDDTSLMRPFFLEFFDYVERLKPLPTHLLVVLSAVGPRVGECYKAPRTFRHELHHDYQPSRALIPKHVAHAVAILKAFFDAMQIPNIQVAGADPDDVLATVALRAVSNCVDVVVASDKQGFLQLLQPRVSILQRRDSDMERYFLADLHAELHLKPSQVTDFLAMVGNPRDAVPGVKGIGRKTAMKLMLEYGSLDNILVAASQIKTKTARDALSSEDGRANAHNSRELSTLRTNIDIPSSSVSPDAMLWQAPKDEGMLCKRHLRAMHLPTKQIDEFMDIYHDLATQTAAATKQ